ncbi:hypothetical protein RSO41_13500 [Halomonas sp. I1]|uniref:hypothetical protein n=1 Tax=Halomonas sp. I1 TaxID=393536 RepID=UPI0028DE90D5|nr:hypothetical protein [Halomonas sp. I1]MDT8895667.1 hypothetical protein [Halomonas sp. I1]
MRFIGRIIKYLGIAISLWVLFGAASLIYQLWGIIALLAAIFLFPAAAAIFPFYAGFALDNWGYLQWGLIGAFLTYIGFFIQGIASPDT